MSQALTIRFKVKKKAGTVTISNKSTSSEIIFQICKQYRMDDIVIERQSLVVLPVSNFPGVKFKNDEIPFESNLGIPSNDQVFSLYISPVLVNIFTRKGEHKALLLDFNAPLTNFTPQICQVFSFDKKSIAYKINSTRGEKWIHSQDSLSACGFVPESDKLFAYDSSTLHKISSDIRKSLNIGYSGWLYRYKYDDKFKNGEDKLRDKKSRRWVVQSDFFLSFYKSQGDTSADYVMALDSYSVSFVNEPKLNERYLKMDSLMLPSFVLLADRDIELSQWMTRFDKKCANTGVNRVFGVDLIDLLNKEGRRGVDNIPRVLRESIAYLDAHLETEGIFRLAGVTDEIQHLKNLYDLGEAVDLNDQSPYVVADVLKAWIRELPEPLLTYTLYDKCMEIGRNESSKEVKKNMIIEKLFEIPIENLAVIQFLCSFFNRVSKYQELNKMNLSNLSLMLGPNILRSNSESNLIELLKDAPIVNEVTEILIVNDYDVFEVLRKRQEMEVQPTDISSFEQSRFDDPTTLKSDIEKRVQTLESELLKERNERIKLEKRLVELEKRLL